MKTNRSILLARCLSRVLGLVLATHAISSSAATVDPAAPGVTKIPAADTNGDAAWLEVQKAARPPAPPKEWNTQRPTREEMLMFRASQGKLAVKAADAAKDFYAKFPDHKMAGDARKLEFDLVNSAIQLGETGLTERVAQIETARLSDKAMTEDERFEIRGRAVQRAALAKKEEGMPAVLAEYEKGIRALQKDFPKRPEIYSMLLAVAENGGADKGRQVAQEIVDSPSAPTEIKEAARSILKKMEALGKPVAINFTAVDGRKVDLTKMKDKVVLVDFWATWCGPCIEELPNVKAAYDKLHPRGFEIVGISFDSKKDKLVEFLGSEKMVWPQYYDGKGWENEIGQKYGITSIPAMWLIDKKGNLRDLEGREDLVTKVEKLLAE